MKLYSDAELKHEIRSIYFGEVKAGETKKVTIWVHNDTEALYTNLEFKIKDDILQAREVKIENPPITIQPGATESLVLSWTASKTLKQALEVTLLIFGDEVYLAKKIIPIEK